MALLANAMSSLSLGAVASPSGLGFRKAVAAFTPSARVGPTSRGAAVFQIFATQNKKARTLQSRGERIYNKQRKSEITTRMKKVFVKATALKAGECTEADIGVLEKLISEATKAVDKAVGKGVLHGNTGARRKSRMSKYKQELRKEKGLYMA